jgi:hypothetical protein
VCGGVYGAQLSSDIDGSDGETPRHVRARNGRVTARLSSLASLAHAHAQLRAATTPATQRYNQSPAGLTAAAREIDALASVPVAWRKPAVRRRAPKKYYSDEFDTEAHVQARNTAVMMESGRAFHEQIAAWKNAYPDSPLPPTPELPTEEEEGAGGGEDAPTAVSPVAPAPEPLDAPVDTVADAPAPAAAADEEEKEEADGASSPTFTADDAPDAANDAFSGVVAAYDAPDAAESPVAATESKEEAAIGDLPPATPTEAPVLSSCYCGGGDLCCTKFVRYGNQPLQFAMRLLFQSGRTEEEVTAEVLSVLRECNPVVPLTPPSPALAAPLVPAPSFIPVAPLAAAFAPASPLPSPFNAPIEFPDSFFD